jgi:hypothetical protein
VPQYLRILACDVLMYNWDSYYDHGRNFYLYENPTTSLIEWIPWDYNLAFSTLSTNIIIPYPTAASNKPLVKNMQANTQLKTNYFNQLCNLLNTQFTNALLNPFIDSTANLIRPSLILDNNKFFTIAQFNTSITSNITATNPFGQPAVYRGLKSFITSRQSTVRSQLTTNGYACAALNLNEIKRQSFLVYPNTSIGLFNITSEKEIYSVEVLDVKGQQILYLNPKTNKAEINITAFSDGLYFLKIISAGQQEVVKILKQE